MFLLMFLSSCFVVKKKYPKEIYLGHANSTSGELLICKDGTTSLKLDGKFEQQWVINETSSAVELKDITDESEQKMRIDQTIFNVLLVSSDPSIVEVVNSSKLQIKGKSTGTATITAYLVDDSGNVKSPASINSQISVSVIEPAQEIMVCNSSFNFIENALNGNQTIGNNGSIVLYAFLKDKNDNFIINGMALNLLDVKLLTDKGLIVSTSLETQLGISCVKITIANQTGHSVSTEIVDKLLISCGNVLCGDGVGLNKIISLGATTE